MSGGGGGVCIYVCMKALEAVFFIFEEATASVPQGTDLEVASLVALPCTKFFANGLHAPKLIYSQFRIKIVNKDEIIDT